MRRVALAILALLTVPASAHAQYACPNGRCQYQAVGVRSTSYQYYQYAPVYQGYWQYQPRWDGRQWVYYPVWVQLTPRTGPTSPQAAPQPSSGGQPVSWAVPSSEAVLGDAGAFLVALNAWRAAYGRPALSWDASLAGLINQAHSSMAPGSSGQVWSGYGNLTTSLSAWQASPAHAAILLSATQAVWAGPAAGGVGANVR